MRIIMKFRMLVLCCSPWLFICFILGFASSASACSPLENTDVYFEKNSASISVSQLQKLAEWVGLMISRYPNRHILRLNANVEVGEIGGEYLGRQRELAVRRALIDLQFTGASVKVGEKVPLIPPVKPHDPIQEDIKRVELEFTPGCPRACGGCP